MTGGKTSSSSQAEIVANFGNLDEVMVLSKKNELVIEDLNTPEVKAGTHLLELMIDDGNQTVIYGIKLIIHDEPMTEEEEPIEIEEIPEVSDNNLKE